MVSRRPVQLSLSVRPPIRLARTSWRSDSPPSPDASTGREERDVDSTAFIAIALSAGIILTTIHTQDYKDTPGDVAAGRITLPIAYPALSRAATALLLIAWSRGLSWTWRLDEIAAGFIGVLGLIVGVRFVTQTGVRADIISSHLYNVSFTIRDCLSDSHAIFVSSGFVLHFYSLNITGRAWYRDQLVLTDCFRHLGADGQFYRLCCRSSTRPPAASRLSIPGPCTGLEFCPWFCLKS
jgi:hypothetical protein